MDKILDQRDEDTPITNPKEPVRTFFRKLLYRIDILRSKLARGDAPRTSSEPREDKRE